MRSKTRQLKDMFGGEWIYDGQNCWEDEKNDRFVRRVRGHGAAPIHMLYQDGHSHQVDLRRENR